MKLTCLGYKAISGSIFEKLQLREVASADFVAQFKIQGALAEQLCIKTVWL